MIPFLHLYLPFISKSCQHPPLCQTDGLSPWFVSDTVKAFPVLPWSLSPHWYSLSQLSPCSPLHFRLLWSFLCLPPAAAPVCSPFYSQLREPLPALQKCVMMRWAQFQSLCDPSWFALEPRVSNPLEILSPEASDPRVRGHHLCLSLWDDVLTPHTSPGSWCFSGASCSHLCGLVCSHAVRLLRPRLCLCCFFIFKFLLIYLWLCWVSVAAPRISLVAVSGAQASHCSGSSCCRTRALGTRVSAVATCRLRGCVAWV